MHDSRSIKTLSVFLLVIALFLTGNIKDVLAQQPSSHNIMELARYRYIDNLVFPHNYKTGKFSATGIPRRGARTTLLELNGPGELTRIWTTLMNEKDVMNLYIYVDDEKEPVLSGITREIAAAAQKFSCPAVPWGGFLDGYSVSLYLPIPFKKHIRIEAEWQEKIQDGPYWQIDYRLGVDAGSLTWKQEKGPDGMKFIPINQKDCENMVKQPVCETIYKEVRVSSHPVDILIDGPAVIREIHINSNYLENFELRVAVDGEGGYSDPASRIDNPDFQVNVPLKYLISNFYTAGIQLQGTTASIYFPIPVKKEALLQLQFMMEENEFHSAFPAIVRIEYEKNPPDIDRMYYFHAATSTEFTNGYQDFEVMNVRGKGHFVGVNLFDTNHDHGGGENIFYDAGNSNAGQLHGICGEDYFHHAYMRIGVSAPYTHCPTHSARCRHHIEMPVPFNESFTYNWGCFAGSIPKAVAIWYQKELTTTPSDELTYQITGPFSLEEFDNVSPGKDLPDTVAVHFAKRKYPRKTWKHLAQNGFVDLCHAFRQYTGTIPPFSGHLEFNSCYMAETKIWAAEDAETRFLIGCDDRIRVYLGDKLILDDAGNNHADPFEQFSTTATLKAGINTITVVVANTSNWNWEWNGFSLVPENNLGDEQLRF